MLSQIVLLPRMSVIKEPPKSEKKSNIISL